jgi:hypothetical protein
MVADPVTSNTSLFASGFPGGGIGAITGKGKRLFGDGTPTAMLKMVDHRVTAKGTVIATYEPGGTLPALPPFGPQPSTSSREAERQRRMAEGGW